MYYIKIESILRDYTNICSTAETNPQSFVSQVPTSQANVQCSPTAIHRLSKELTIAKKIRCYFRINSDPVGRNTKLKQN